MTALVLALNVACPERGCAAKVGEPCRDLRMNDYRRERLRPHERRVWLVQREEQERDVVGVR